MHHFSFLIELEVLSKLLSPVKKSPVSKLIVFFLNSKAWLWLLLSPGGAQPHSGMAAGAEGAAGGLSAGLAGAWRSVREGGANRGCRQGLVGGEDQLGCQEGVFSTTLYRIGTPISEGFHACLQQTWNCCQGVPACMQLQQPD